MSTYTDELNPYSGWVISVSIMCSTRNNTVHCLLSIYTPLVNADERVNYNKASRVSFKHSMHKPKLPGGSTYTFNVKKKLKMYTMYEVLLLLYLTYLKFQGNWFNIN